MSNDYFDSGDYTALTKNTSARASAVNAIFAAVEAAFDILPDKLVLLQDRVTYVTASGTDAYTASLSSAPPAYVEGLHLRVKFTNANTETQITLNLNGLGAKNIYATDGERPAIGAIGAGMICDLVYDGTAFRIMSSAADPGGGSEGQE